MGNIGKVKVGERGKGEEESNGSVWVKEQINIKWHRKKKREGIRRERRRGFRAEK